MNQLFSQPLDLLKRFIEQHSLNRIDCCKILSELYACGVTSSIIVSISGLFIGAVLTLQGVYMLEQFSSANQVGHVVALSILREIGPILTSLLFIGNACSATTSEIGIMRLTEQHNALKSLAISPYRYIYVPKFIAGITALPLLFSFFCTFSILGAYTTATQLCGIDNGLFWINIREHVHLTDMYTGLVKVIIFSIAINLIAIRFGAKAPLSSSAIAHSTTASVVTCSVLIFFLDVCLTHLFLQGVWQ